ncbi:glycosyltransferase [Aeromonas jandaei]|uniref:Glycosyltransferase n=1 Tax=Aeromonas jandaei TaxID=650 RepID=A0A7T4AAQ6_AERJA|nr:glycosyltransferase [Aeromonas jandaei]QQB20429.1 glycosyltransferase [Aeromonas jandaei]UCA35129.1 glycosyltransferase [Aeromonas jandaei]
MKKKIVIFGVGSLYKRALPYINGVFDIVALSDNNSCLHDSIIDGIPVISPPNIIGKEFDGVVILSSYSKEIIDQLIKIGVDELLITNGQKMLTGIFQPLLERALICSDRYASNAKSDISFFIDTLGNGGAEKALVDLTTMLSKNFFSASIIVLFNIGCYFDAIPSQFPIRILFNPSDKELVEIAFKLINWNVLRRILKITNSRIDVSFLDGFSSFLVVAGNASKKIGWIHSDVSYYLDNEQKKKEASAVYSLFTDVVFVTKNSQVAWDSLFPDIKQVKKHVIYNIVNIDDITSHKKNRDILAFDKLTFVTVGRLDYVKGFDLLINICHRLNNEGYDNYQLLIIGEGSDRPLLLNMIEELNIPNISFLGHLAYPYDYIDAADFFLSSSRAEGFSLAILEALLLRTPVIATKTAGSMELITRLGGGILVENNIDALYSEMKSACDGKLNVIFSAKEDFENINRETCGKIINILRNEEDTSLK